MNSRISYLIVIILAFWAYIFTPVKGLDLYYYYYEYLPEDKSYTIPEFIMNQVETNNDFMYRVSLMAVDSIGMPIQLVNMFYVGLYYFLIYKILSCYIIKKKIRLSSNAVQFICISSFFSALPILVFSISRTLSAIVVLYIGIYLILNNKYVIGLIILFLSITFHIAALLFLFSLGSGLLFNIFNFSRRINSHFLFKLSLGLLGVFFLLGLPVLFSQIQAFILSLNIFYTYAGTKYFHEDSISLLDGDYLRYLTYGKLLLMVVMYLCIISIKKSDILVNFAIPVFLFFCFVSGTMPFVGDRLMMLIPVLWGTMMLQVMNEYKEKRKNTIIFSGSIVLTLLFSFYCVCFESKSFFGFL